MTGVQTCALPILALLFLLLSPADALARVVRVTIDKRELIGGGAAFGPAGAYERITGRVYFAFDPANPRDRRIVDLDLAPRNAVGEVEAWSEFVMLLPRDPARRTGVTLVDVVNRGGMTVGVFQLGAQRSASPTDNYTEEYTLSLHDALPICRTPRRRR